MRCAICKKMLRADNKSGVCSNCSSRNLGSLIKDRTIKLEEEIKNISREILKR